MEQPPLKGETRISFAGQRESQAPSSLFLDAWRRLLRNKLAIVGMVIIAFFIIAAVLAPLLAPYDPTEQILLQRRQPPSRQHWMGLDEVGRDILSRVIYGARVSLQIGLLSVSLAIIVGSILGAISGFVGGWLDDLIMRFMDILLAFPGLLLAIAVVSILGPGLMNMLYAIAFVSIPIYARIMRASVLSVKEQDFVMAARAVGVPTLRILWREILPNSLTPIIVSGTLGIATAILDAAGLSFLGLGAQPPTAEWGSMLGEGRGSVFTAPHIVVFPGLAIMLNVLGFNLLGDGLRDALDPRLRM
jgi:peptide/nickel transport system permease protein